MNRSFIFTLLCACLLPTAGFMQNNFVVKDVLVSDPSSSIIDPEYNIALNSVCWISSEEELWVCSLDPVTRHFMPSDGKGILVDWDLTPPTFGGWNGPEWMLSQGCTQIVYNQKKGGTRYPAIATQFIGGWTTHTLMEYPGALYAMATRNYSDTVSMFLFESNMYDGIRWVKNTDLSTCHFYPDITLGFFAYDDQQICCALNHSRQPGFLEVATTLPFFTQISNDTIGAPFMWKDPETNSRMFMYRTNSNKTVKVFQENSDGNWYLYHSFNSPVPDPFLYITSPEPFVFGGRSYISFMAAQAGMGLAQEPAQIWITSVDPVNSFMRRVSDTTDAARSDPEPVIFSDSAFIYYTEKVFTKWGQFMHRVRKCDTGLESMYTPTIDVNYDLSEVQITPNPTTGSALISGSILGQKPTTIMLYDLSGRVLFRTVTAKEQYLVDFSGFPNGVYLLKSHNDRGAAATRLILHR